MKHSNLRRKLLSIVNYIQESSNELTLKTGCFNDSISLYNSNDNLNKCEELKLLFMIYDSLMADLTRSFLQNIRLTEENQRLKEEFQDLSNKN